MTYYKRLRKEVERLVQNSLDGIVCYPKDDSMTTLNATITGAAGTPYEGGSFNVELKMSENYPFKPPAVQFITKVYHPNIDEEGRICLDLLQSGWVPCVTIEKVLLAVQSLLAQPNISEPLVLPIAEECRVNPDLFAKNARKWTSLYAKSTPFAPDTS